MDATYFRKIVDEVNRENLDALLVAPSLEMYSLIGFMPMLCLRFQGLFITKEGSSFYVCNILTRDEIAQYLPGVKIYTWHDNDGFIEAVHRAFFEHGLMGKTIGVNSAVRAFNILEIASRMDVWFVNAEHLLSEVRIYKTDEELSLMKKAAQIGVEALKRTVPEIHVGMLEQEVKTILERNMRLLGADHGSAMVASGPNSGFPHYNSSSRRLQRGDTLLIDFGCLYKGMLCDITRTFFLEEISPKQKEIYELVRVAIETAEERLQQGERWIPEIDTAARQIIDQAGYGEFFTTRLGHGLGHMPHEAPDIKANHKRMLEPRMAFTIEPGIYTEEFGVRIEDCLAIGQDGHPVIFSDGFSKACTIIG